MSVDLDGDDERTHLTSEWATEFAVSPDGRWIGWTERFNAYVAPFVAAGRPIAVSADGKALPQARVTRDAGDWLSWSGDSQRLQWSLGPELFTRDLNQAFTFVEGAPDELPKPDERGINIGFTADADKPQGRMALTGARLITMNGTEVIENGVVIVDGNRIEAIGPAASTPSRRAFRSWTWRARPSCPASSTATGTGRWARTRSSRSRAGSTMRRWPSG